MMTLMEPLLQREQYIKDLTAENARLRAALEEYPEWLNERDEDGEITGTQYCLVCNETELRGHKSDCLRVLALSPAAAVTGAA